MYKRPIFHLLLSRLNEPRRCIQVLYGPRQTGKTTIARQILSEFPVPGHYASADEPALKDHSWIEKQWETGRAKILMRDQKTSALLVLDEIQKIPGWSETVKRLWDDDSHRRTPLYVVLLGSSPLLVQQGLTESLTGRFEIVYVTHWGFSEMREAFGWDLSHFLFYGGYPGSADLITDHNRWRHYIQDSLIETSVSRDILLMKRVDKPALLRRLFELGCLHSSQILSYQKMLGQLLDAGNTVTLAHYLQLLHGAGLIAGLPKYSGQQVKQRGSSPKLVVLNTALMSTMSNLQFEEALQNPTFWGRLVESAVGGWLINGSMGKSLQVFYWAGSNREVDYILTRGETVIAIEVKSGSGKISLPGMEILSRRYKIAKKMLVGRDGIPLEDFFLTPPEDWLAKS
ncbi:MAG: ATP-binding protein [Deltaproteobacteria bacterium]|nr:ATP-binding protein [Deltaproteobacteria bacterium]